MVIPENWRDTLLNLAKSACDEYGIKETTLGNRIVKDADFFPELRDGAGCGVDKYQKIMVWFKENLHKPKQFRTPKQLKERGL